MSLKLNTAKEEAKRFNEVDELIKIIGPDKAELLLHKAKYVDVVAAKDTGKSFPLELMKIYIMERDPMASILTLMKFSTNAAKRGTRSFYTALSYLKRKGYNLPLPYEPSTSFMYRVKDKKIKIKNQAIEYGSFENSDGLAGYTVSNGGYPALIHIEEPVLQGDTSETVSLNQWNADLKTIEDTVQRHWRDYNLSVRDENGELLPHKHAPIPFKIITTMNDWDPFHPVSVRTEKYSPQSKFLDWALGYDYAKLRELWKDKVVDANTVVPELQEWVDERWEDIKKNVLENHTHFVYVEKNSLGGKEDRLVVRMQKFANPVARNDIETRENVYNDMYMALVTGDNLGLAKAFGMGFGGTLDEEKLFAFKSFQPKDTKKIINEHGRHVIAFSMGWDHDANRGPVGTPCTLSGIRYNDGTPFDPIWKIRDMKVCIHPQVEIEGYGKGDAGANTKRYHDMMIDISREQWKEYGRNADVTFAIFDDDDGSYVSHIAQDFRDIGYHNINILENKNGKIETNGFGVVSRDKLWQQAIDIDDIIVDQVNTMLVDWLKQVPRMQGADGTTKRMTKEKWGRRYKDISNSAEYAWWPFRFALFEGL